MIKKTSETTPTMASVVNTQSDSTEDTYSCDYVNNCNTYSTSEIDTGKVWIDGKKIYRKCFEVLKSQTSSSSINITHNISNLDVLIEQRGVFIRTDDVQGTIPNAMSNYDYNLWFSDFDSTTIRVRMGTNVYSSLSKIVVIVEYTKTTD